MKFDSRRSGTLRHLLDVTATQGAMFPQADGQTEKDVIVYCWDAERFAHRLGATVLAN